MSIDFRAQNIQTEKLIVTGDPDAPEQRVPLVIYPIQAQGTPPNQGDIGDTGLLEAIQGADVFLYVSGAIGGKDGSTRGITVFGGDLHISGNFSLDGTGGGGSGTLQDVITTGTPDNDVSVPTANPIVLRDGGVAGFNTISFIKTGAGSGSQLYLSSSEKTTGPLIKIDIEVGSQSETNAIEMNNGIQRMSISPFSIEFDNPDYGGFEIYGAASTGAAAGQYMYIQAGDGDEEGQGGSAYLRGGEGGERGGTGGYAEVKGGHGGNVSGSGGEAALLGGWASEGTGGIARVAGGDNDYGNNAGASIVQGGRSIGYNLSSGSAGDVIIRGGYTDHSGPAGNLLLSGGYSTSDGPAGNIYLIGGMSDGVASGKIIVESTLHFSQSIFTDIAISSSSRDLANSDSGKIAFINTTGGNVTFIASGSVLSTGWSTMLVREGANSLIISGTAATTLVGPAVTAGAVEITVDYGGVSMVKRSDAIIWCAGVTS